PVALAVAGRGWWRSRPRAGAAGSTGAGSTDAGSTDAGRWRRIAVGLGWLLLAVLLASVGRPWFVGAGLTIALGVYVIVLAIRLRGAERPGSPVRFGTGAPPADD